MSHAEYLRSALSPAYIHTIVDRTIRTIQTQYDAADYDCIVFRGVSGALVAPIVAYQLGRPCVPVRKKHDVDAAPADDGTHSSFLVELLGDYKRYLIIDDQISSGNTIDKIIEACDKLHMDCCGIVLWNHGDTYAAYSPAVKRAGPEYWRLPPDEGVFWHDETERSFPVHCMGLATTYTYESE